MEMTIATPLAIPEISLNDLAVRINEKHRACEASLSARLERAMEAGELLLKAKAGIGHGGWLAWLDEHCEAGRRMVYGRFLKPASLHGTVSQLRRGAPRRRNRMAFLLTFDLLNKSPFCSRCCYA